MIEDVVNREQYVVRAGKVFQFPHRFFRKGDIEVWLEGNGGSVKLVSGLDYEVETKEDYSSGAEITLKTGTANVPVLPTGKTLTILRMVPYTQGTSLPLNGKLPSKAVESQLDHIVAGMQQLAEGLRRSVKVDPTSKIDPANLIEELKELATVAEGREFETVREMENATDLEPGAFYRTAGFWSFGDGGGCDYWAIKKDSDIMDTSGGMIAFLSVITHWRAQKNKDETVPDDITEWRPEKDYAAGDWVSVPLPSRNGDRWMEAARRFCCVSAQSAVQNRITESEQGGGESVFPHVPGVPYNEQNDLWLLPLVDVNRVNAKQLGAKGDGVTDDTAAIQAAFNCPSAATVYFPNGTYMVTPFGKDEGFWNGLLSGDCAGPRYALRIPSYIGIEGDRATIKVADEAAPYSGIFAQYCNTVELDPNGNPIIWYINKPSWCRQGLTGFRMEGVTIDENAAGNIGYYATDAYITSDAGECGWQKATAGLGNVGLGCAWVISSNIADGVVIRNCRFRGYGKNLVKLEQCTGTRIENNVFSFEHAGLGAERVQYDNSLLFVKTNAGGDVVVQGNTFENVCDFSKVKSEQVDAEEIDSEETQANADPQIDPWRLALYRPFGFGAVEITSLGRVSVRNNLFTRMQSCVNMTLLSITEGGTVYVDEAAQIDISDNTAEECIGFLSLFNIRTTSDLLKSCLRNVKVSGNRFHADGGWLRFIGKANIGETPYMFLHIRCEEYKDKDTDPPKNLEYDIRGLSVTANVLVFTGNPNELYRTEGGYYLKPRGMFHLWSGYTAAGNTFTLHNVLIADNRVLNFPAPGVLLRFAQTDIPDLYNVRIEGNEFSGMWAYNGRDNNAAADITMDPFLTEKSNVFNIKNRELLQIHLQRNTVTLYQYPEGAPEGSREAARLPVKAAGPWDKFEFQKVYDAGRNSTDGGLMYDQVRPRDPAVIDPFETASAGSRMLSESVELAVSGVGLAVNGYYNLAEGYRMSAAGMGPGDYEPYIKNGATFSALGVSRYQAGDTKLLGGMTLLTSAGGVMLHAGDEIRTGSGTAHVVSGGFYPVAGDAMRSAGSDWISVAGQLCSGAATLTDIGSALVASGSSAANEEMKKLGSTVQVWGENLLSSGSAVCERGLTLIASGGIMSRSRELKHLGADLEAEGSSAAASAASAADSNWSSRWTTSANNLFSAASLDSYWLLVSGGTASITSGASSSYEAASSSLNASGNALIESGSSASNSRLQLAGSALVSMASGMSATWTAITGDLASGGTATVPAGMYTLSGAWDYGESSSWSSGGTSYWSSGGTSYWSSGTASGWSSRTRPGFPLGAYVIAATPDAAVVEFPTMVRSDVTVVMNGGPSSTSSKQVDPEGVGGLPRCTSITITPKTAVWA